ncbi:MAG: HNH endonuclease [Pseudomonadota bacterium]
MTNLLVCNIGWMKEYKGVTESDSKPQGGGQYNIDHVGHEACNFLPCDDGYCYGYVEASNKNSTIDITNFDKEANQEIDGITVVWVSRNPDPKDDRTVVVGWYKNATIFRNPKKNTLYPSYVHKANKISFYNIRARIEDVVLLSETDRNYGIPRTRSKEQSGIGRSNIWYASKKKDKKIRKEILEVTRNNPLDFCLPDLDYLAIEGKTKLCLHIARERSQKLAQVKKKNILKKTGKLECEVCGFNFKDFYGELLQEEFCEVHHRVPLSKLTESTEIVLDDLAILCSNCHRVIHRTNPIMNVESFSDSLRKAKKETTTK